MTSRSGPVARALRMAGEDLARVRFELARARRTAGLSQAEVARACGLSRAAMSRLETGANRRVTIEELARVGGAVALDVRIRTYPAGDPIRDAGQARLLERFRSRLGPGLTWSTEVPLPLPGDLRAWDAIVRSSTWRIGVEAETVIDDVQAVERRLALKRRDGEVDHVILLVSDTPRNRRAVAAAGAAFGDLPLRTRDILAALRDGRDPGGSGLVFL